jgi:hypothetical protein
MLISTPAKDPEPAEAILVNAKIKLGLLKQGSPTILGGKRFHVVETQGQNFRWIHLWEWFPIFLEEAHSQGEVTLTQAVNCHTQRLQIHQPLQF